MTSHRRWSDVIFTPNARWDVVSKFDSLFSSNWRVERTSDPLPGGASYGQVPLSLLGNIEIKKTAKKLNSVIKAMCSGDREFARSLPVVCQLAQASVFV